MGTLLKVSVRVNIAGRVGWGEVEGGWLSITANPVDGIFKGDPGEGGDDGEDKDVHGAGYWLVLVGNLPKFVLAVDV